MINMAGTQSLSLPDSLNSRSSPVKLKDMTNQSSSRGVGECKNGNVGMSKAGYSYSA